MTIDKLWEGIFNYDTYVKGGEYSASDITGDILAVKLRKLHPNHKEMKYEDKISAYMGTSIHDRIEKWIESENAFGETNMESEVRLKYKNLSGTCDLILDGKTIVDYKTGKEDNIKKKIKDSSDWITQLSIYRYLANKTGYKIETKAYIAWLCVDNNKHGIHEIELLSEKETIAVIKEFMTEISKEPKDLPKCNLCIQFKHRWCNQKANCPYWVIDKDFSSIEEW
ncbi:PD-(D/E)XK nuclease family protein [bacterium]|nr:PD-(D/E)XK nuclease family protein [bacterium]